MRDQSAPVFVKVEEYKEILDVLEMIRAKIKEIRETLGNINSLRNEEDTEIAMWNATIIDIEKKVDGIDKVMFEPDRIW